MSPVGRLLLPTYRRDAAHLDGSRHLKPEPILLLDACRREREESAPQMSTTPKSGQPPSVLAAPRPDEFRSAAAMFASNAATIGARQEIESRFGHLHLATPPHLTAESIAAVQEAQTRSTPCTPKEVVPRYGSQSRHRSNR